MTANVINTSEIQKQAELEAYDQIAGAGAEPQYVTSDDGLAYPVDEAHGADGVQLTSSSTPSSPNLDAAANAAKTSPPKTLVEAEEDYLENTSEYKAALDGSDGAPDETENNPPVPPPPPPPGDEEVNDNGDAGGAEGPEGSQGSGGTQGSNGDYGFVDAFGSVDDGFDDAFGDWKESDFINEGGDGDYDTLNEEALESYMRNVLKLLNKLLGLAMVATLGQEIRDVVNEILSGKAIEKDASKGLKAAILRSFTHTMKTVQKGFSMLLDKVNKHNQEVYKDKVRKAQKKSSSTGFKVENWYKAGYPAQELNRKMAREQERYLQALDQNVNAFKTLIQLMIELVKEGMVEGAEANELLIGITNALSRTVTKIDEFSDKIDEKLEECRKYLEELEAIDSCKKGWKMFGQGIKEGSWSKMWSGLQGALRAGQNWLEKNIPLHGYLLSWALEGLQWGMSLLKNPVEFVLNFVENLLDIIAVALDKIGEFIDKVVYTVTFASFGWIGLILNGEWGVGDWGAGNGDFVSTWKNWDGYGTHGVGDLVQAVGKELVDGILDDIILDNVIDGIRMVLYEGVSYVWNWVKSKTAGWITWLPYGFVWLDSLSEPGERDYFGIERIHHGKVVQKEDLATYNTFGSNPIYTPEAFQDLALDQLIMDLRGGMIRHQNAYRIYLQSQLLKADMRNAVFRELTGLNGCKGNGDLLVKASEIVATPSAQILDGALSTVMLRASVYNNHLLTIDALQKLEAARTAQAVAVLTTAITVVLAIIIAVKTLGAGSPASALLIASACMAIASAASNAVAQKILADIESFTVQKPDVDAYAETEMADVGGAVEDVLHNIDQEIMALERGLASGEDYLVQTQDGMYHLDYKALANLERRLNALNNAIRTLFYLAKQKRDLRRLVQAILRGTSEDATGEGLTLSALESMLAQRSVQVSGITFQLQQVVAARNMARQKEIAMANSNSGAAGPAAGGLIALALCWVPGIGGFLGAFLNICISLGSAIGSIASALGDEGNALGMKFRSKDKELDDYLEQRARNDESFESKLDRLEAEAMLELMENGIVGTGDGYHDVNAPLLAQTYNRLQKIYQMKQILSDVLSLNAKMRSVVQRELTGVTPQSGNDLSKAVNQANLNTALRVVNKLSSHIKTTTMVMNQARDAEKNLTMALATSAVNVVVSVLSLIGLARLDAGMLLNVCKMAPVFMNVANSLTSMIISAVSADSGKGFYSKYNVNHVVDKMDTNQISKGKSWEERLEEKEYEIMREMETDLISSMGCAAVSVSADTAGIFLSMNKLYNVRTAIAMAMQIMQDVKAAMGHHTPKSSLEQIIEGSRAAATSTLGALKGALDSIANRENQITQAQVQAIISAVNLAIALAVLSLSLPKAKLMAKAEAAEKGGNPYKANKLLPTVKTLTKWIAALNFIGGVIASVIPACFDQHYKDNPVGQQDSQKARQDKDQKSASGKGKAESKGGEGGGFAASMGRMDEEIARADYNLASYEAEQQALVYLASTSERTAQFLKNLPLQIVQLITDLFAPQKGLAPTHDDEDQKAKDSAKKAAAAAALKAKAADQTKVGKSNQKGPSTTGQLQYLNKLDEKFKAIQQKTALLEANAKEQKAKGINVQQSTQEIDKLKKQQADTQAKAEGLKKAHQTASSKVQKLSKESADLQTELDKLEKDFNRKKDALKQLKEVRDKGQLDTGKKAKVEEDIAKLEKECKKLKAQIEALKEKIKISTEKLTTAQGEEAKIGDQIKAFDKEVAKLGEQATAAIKAQLADIEAALKSIQAQISGLESKKTAVDKEIADWKSRADIAQKKKTELEASLKVKKEKFLIEADKLPENLKKLRAKEIEDLKANIEVNKAEKEHAEKKVLELEQNKEKIEGEIKGLQRTAADLKKLRDRLKGMLPPVKEEKKKEGKKAINNSFADEMMKDASSGFLADLKATAEANAQQQENINEIVKRLRGKDAKLSLAMLRDKQLDAKQTADAIIQVANDPYQDSEKARKKALKMLELVKQTKGPDYLKAHESRIMAALPAPAPKKAEESKPTTPVKTEAPKKVEKETAPPISKKEAPAKPVPAQTPIKPKVKKKEAKPVTAKKNDKSEQKNGNPNNNGSFFTWLFGGNGSSKAPEPVQKRGVSVQVGNISGQNIHEQFARLEEDKKTVGVS